MKKNHLNYLTIPTITSLLYIFLALALLSIDSNTQSVYNDNPTFFIVLFAINIVTAVITLFIPTLIFSITFNLTKLNIKNISYALLIALAVISLGAIINYLITLNLKAISSYHNGAYLRHITNVYFLLYNLLSNLIILGISYLYSYFYKPSSTTLSQKYICVLYASLFVALSIPSLFGFGIFAMDYFSFNIFQILFLITIAIINLIVYFMYFYTWSNQLLHSYKDTTHYAFKIILAYIMTLIFALLITIILAFLFTFFMYLSNYKDLFILFAIIGLILGYILGIIFFFSLLNVSDSKLYQYMHWCVYIVMTLCVFAIMLLSASSRTSPLELILSTITIYGIALFLLSLSLKIFYKSGELAINLLFKAKTNSLKK